MIIHTVTECDTVYTIARRYSIPPTKLLADNARDGDRLTIGEELIILPPTRTVTVRGADTKESIAKRFSITQNQLMIYNPQLSYQQRLKPGQVLSVKQNYTAESCGAAVGIAKKGLIRERLLATLPFITYLVVEGAVLTDSGIGMRFDPTGLSDIAKKEKKISLLSIKDESCGRFLEKRENLPTIIEKMISLTKKYGFSGIAFDAKEARESKPNLLSDFLVEIRGKFIGCDLLLFSYLDESTGHEAAELSDGGILTLEDRDIRKTLASLEKYSIERESSKVFASLSTEAKIGDDAISEAEAKALAYKCGLRLNSDRETLMQGFTYTRYKIGKGEKNEVFFPSLEYTKAKLGKIGELGFGGISFDIGTVEISKLCMFSALFRRADYALP